MSRLSLVDTGPPTDLTETECAGAVIVLGGSYVVLVRPVDPSKNEWLLPKGHVEKAESLSDCALREAREETGAVCKLHIPEPIMTTRLVTPKEAKTISWFILHAAALKTELAELLPERLIQRREIGIFPSTVAMARLTYEEHREVLATALNPHRQVPEDY